MNVIVLRLCYLSTQECYVHNLLRVSVYIPDLRRDILELIISKMLTLDVSGTVLMSLHLCRCLTAAFTFFVLIFFQKSMTFFTFRLVHHGVRLKKWKVELSKMPVEHRRMSASSTW